MPELPDIVVYIEALGQRVLNQTLERVTVAAPFLLRTAVPAITSVEGRKVVELRRLGKRICFGMEEDFWLVLHLMIAGRLHWNERAVARGFRVRASKNRLATFDFTSGTLSVTEAGTQRRASLHVVQGEAELQRFNPGGLEIFETTLDSFAEVLQSENHTLKRSLTDPRLFSGIGNAYSDEILFDAQLSPVALTQKLTSQEIERLFKATRGTLTKWVKLLRKESTPGFPKNVTAFRPEMAVHGKYQQPCPRCGNKIQRIRYASNETNYCPNCQTAGKLLADRALSRLLRADWPRTADELEGLVPTPRN
ncbi:MAG TPA: formamidopyrimidine-DNA glycosylase [Blastocatellia bacterium]|jgi:formamidopyrimidine-DNA glycosylase|nr:formamidopyrimidine-DNA glycosylase [Blastocatellia bacterium]HAF21886.1 formamidopyrimidine-DNA glycosylase [Blastocatellia bacterium]